MYNETKESIQKRILDNTKSDLSKIQGSTLSNIAAGISIPESEIITAINEIEKMVFIESGYDEFLEKRCSEFGIYKKDGEKAKGIIYVSGMSGAKILNGDKIEYGGLLYVVIQDLVLQEDPELNFTQVEATDVGIKYNVPAESNFELVEANYNIDRIYNKVAFQGGIEPETDDELRFRFELFQRNKATSGNVADYVQWAMSVDGIQDVRVFPLWNGNGTVKVLVFGAGDGLVDDETLKNCQEFINYKKPIGADVTVVRPVLQKVDIVATVVSKDNSNLDLIKSEYMVALNEYFKDAGKEISYLKVMGILASLDDIVDIKDITLNGSKNNITLTDEQIAIADASSITEAVV